MLKEYQLLYLDNDIPINRSFYCNNGDIKSRGLEVHVLDNSQAKDCTGLTIKMIVKVPSGEMFEATVANGLVTVLSAAGGIYQILFPNNMGRGRLIAEIQLSNAVPEVIVSRKFSIIGDGSLTSDGSISVLPQGGILWDIIQNEAQRQVDFDAILGSLDAEVALKYAELETTYAPELNLVKSQLAERALKSALEVEKARINSFTALAAGSTTGDAELIDSRVGADGVTYPNAGGAIRGQISGIKQNIEHLINDTIEVTIGKNLCPPKLYDGYIEADGSIAVYSDWKTTEHISVDSLTSVAYSVSNSAETRLLGVAMFFLTTYDSAKNRIEQIASPGSVYTVGAGVAYIRFSLHSNEHHDVMVESGTEASLTYEPYSETYKAVNADYALKSEVSQAQEYVSDIQNNFSLNYQSYTPVYANSPSAIWNDGEIVTNLPDTSTTNEIDCSDWESIMYTGSSWLGGRVLAFYDANHVWISSAPAIDQTTALNNEIIPVPQNAKYVIFSNLSLRVAQDISIKVATDYKILGKWSGKKWTCVGDSLTEHNLRTTVNYHDYIAQATDITVVNLGHSGSGYKRSEDDGNAFYQQVANVPTDADVVTIFGSGNDLLYIADLGTPTDTGTTTICGCINTTIDNIIGLMPTVSLGIVAPTPWVGNQPTIDDSNGMALYTNALKTICKIRSIPFLDLYHCSNLRPWTVEGRAACYSKDEGNGVHPDETGHKIIAPRFKSLIESLLI